jgi:tRNA(Ile)-lysidine synthase
LQGRARDARYALLIQAARDLRAEVVMTGHHQDDQIETHFLAEARHAGDRGLAGMRAQRALAPGLVLLRPFLDIPGRVLKASLGSLPAVDDPSNRDPRFDRARLRQALAACAFDRGAVLAAIARHAAARDAADRRLSDCLRAFGADRKLAVRPVGTVEIDRQALATLAPETAADLLARILRAVGGGDYPPQHAARARLWARLGGNNPSPVAATLGGVAVRGDRTLHFAREFGRVGPMGVTVTGPAPTLFDGRFDVDTAGLEDQAVLLVPLGRLGCGNAIEKTLPVALDAAGRPIAAPACLHAKLGPGVGTLALQERLSWRLQADLPSHPASA